MSPSTSTAATPRIVGKSPAIRQALREARRVAPTAAAVVIRGESGTGKELFARAIHAHSRRTGELVAVNCAALPEAILESMLFGHRRGAFTGATESSVGLIVGADRGTLFLDEVGELPLPVQAKLLRVLQEKAVLPVGETRERRVDLRVIAASHRDLRELVDRGLFREDLYYRLCRFELELPPLRERGRDVVLIARELVSSGRGLEGVGRRQLTRSAEKALVSHNWPGNVRELENVLFRASLISRGSRIAAADLTGAIPGFDLDEGEPLSVRILGHVEDRGEVSVGDLVDAFGRSRSTLKRLVKGMCKAGDLVAIGTGRGTRYRRPSLAHAVHLDERERAAVALVERHGRVTRKELAHEGDLAMRTAGRVLSKLVDLGILAADGLGGRASGYVLAES